MTDFSKKITIRDFFIPESWFSSQESKVLITTFRIINYGDYTPLQTDIIHDYGNIRVGLLFGDISYQNFDEDWDFSEKDRTLQLILKKNDKHKSGAWAIFFQKFDSLEEWKVKQDLSSFLSVYQIVFGKSAVFREEFQHVLHKDNKITHGSSIFLHPNFLHNPSFNEQQFELIDQLVKKIAEEEKTTAERINLSLHWFQKGARTNGVDAFINFWIAIEALAMPNSTDIAPVKKILKNIYSPQTEIKDDRFYIGRIFGLRSNIVHNGYVATITYDMEDYMQSLYVDILFHLLKLPSEQRIKRILERPNFSLEKSLS